MHDCCGDCICIPSQSLDGAFGPDLRHQARGAGHLDLRIDARGSQRRAAVSLSARAVQHAVPAGIRRVGDFDQFRSGAAGTLGHTIRVAGNVTRALARKKVGDQIGVRGAVRIRLAHAVCRGHDVVMACGGVGLAPLRPAIYHVLNHRDDYGRVFLLYGARTPADLLYQDEFEAGGTAAWKSK